VAGTTRRDELEPGEAREIAAAARAGGGDPAPESSQAQDDEFDAAAPGANQSKAKTRASRTAPLTAATKARIRKLAREGKSRNAIAREVGVGAATVTRVCQSAKPPISFDRTATAAAVQAKGIDLKAARAELSGKAIDEVRRLFDLMTTPHEVIHWDKDGFMHRGEIERPTSGDVKNYATAIGILTDKHLALVKHDADARDVPAVDKWLLAMGVGAVEA